MIPPRVSRIGALLAMAAFGFGVYHYLGTTKSTATRAAQKPNQTRAAFSLPGNIYLTQAGTIYDFAHGSFTSLAGSGDWTQPALAPDGSLIAVKREFNYSDLYQLDTKGNVIKQITHNQSIYEKYDVGYDDWSFFPTVTPDGTIFESDDRGKSVASYAVDLAVWSFPLSQGPKGARQWTDPNLETGGDVQPVVMASGALLYTKYDIDANGKNTSEIYLVTRPEYPGTSLTDPGADCSEPVPSPNQTQLAMVCTGGSQQTQLVVDDFNGSALSNQRVLASGGLATAPTWAPDGSGLVYLAPVDSTGHFQLWWQSLATPPSPTPTTGHNTTPAPSASPKVPPLIPARSITTNLDFDATARPAWSA